MKCREILQGTFQICLRILPVTSRSYRIWEYTPASWDQIFKTKTNIYTLLLIYRQEQQLQQKSSLQQYWDLLRLHTPPILVCNNCKKLPELLDLEKYQTIRLGNKSKSMDNFIIDINKHKDI